MQCCQESAGGTLGQPYSKLVIPAPGFEPLLGWICLEMLLQSGSFLFGVGEPCKSCMTRKGDVCMGAINYPRSDEDNSLKFKRMQP